MHLLKNLRDGWSRSIISVYDSHSFHEKRKAEYTSAFILLLIVYMLPGMLIEAFTIGLDWVKTISYLVYYLAIGLLLLYLKRGKLHFVTTALLFAGIIKGLEYFWVPEGFQFYVHVLLCIIITGAIHIRKYQLYTGYVIFNLLLIGRPFLVRSLIGEGLLSPGAMNHTLQAIFGGIIFTLTVDYLTGILEREIDESKKLEQLASTDVLTGLSNRRKLEELYDAPDIRGRQRTMLLIDLDFFKTINDDFGHDVGDRVLQTFSGILHNSLREGDTSYRWGGEEFVALLKGMDRAGGLKIAERLRRITAAYDFEFGRSLTISIGVTEERDGDTLRSMFKRADRALYNAKSAGRNRVESI